MKRLEIIVFVFVMCHAVATAQHSYEWETYYQQLSGMEDMETADWEELHQLLCELEEQPININTAKREDLEQLPFLTDTEVEAIMDYLDRYGEMKSMGELAMIEALDHDKRQLLACFLYAGAKQEGSRTNWKQLLSHVGHDAMFTARVPLYERKGDKNGYLGYPYRYDLRYSMHSGQQLKAGFVGAQDAGEPFFANKNGMGYDHYSFYLLVRNVDKWKNIAVGQYRVSTGLGLVANTDFILGKTAVLQSMGRQRHALRAHSSRSSADYLQGFAATRALSRQMDLTAFLSFRKIDATLNSDSTTISTIVTSGYHRTQTEISKKGNTQQWIAGMNLHWFHRGFHAGATVVHEALNRELNPRTSQLFRQYYASGKHFTNAAVEYGYTGSRFSLKGETAMKLAEQQMPIATLNMITFKPADEVEMLLLQRFYSYRYNAPLARSFSEGGHVQNESGVYFGLNWRPKRTLLLSAYGDFAYFPWARYQVSQSSHAWDYMLTVSYSPKNWQLMMRYRMRRSERDSEEKNTLAWRTEHRGRLALGYDGGKWGMRTQMDAACTRFNQEESKGWMVSENVSLRTSKCLQLNATAAYFHTDDFDSRLYFYERGMLYSFSFPAYYGEGIRYSLMLHAELSDRITLNAKVGITDYFDRSVIGTGLQQIDHSAMTDVEVQLKWKF
ncbi:MAG: helix-hairpin-helix domain-containing protein [Prevotella sp.]|nr:helix-hairpin-helix domain-containing protein [Prevotella sp.]